MAHLLSHPAIRANLFVNYRGNKFYEISNHLGNVLTVINDKKDGQLDSAASMDYYGYYTPQIVSASDYYPFGWMSRSVDVAGYRYGFNGKEKDDDVKHSDGSQYDYGMRIYDPRVGRFLSTDPLSRNYPWWTPYQFAANTPVNSIDIDGAEVPTEKNKNAVEGGNINGRKTINDLYTSIYVQGKPGDNLATNRYVNEDVLTPYLGGVVYPRHISQAVNFADAIDGLAYQKNGEKYVYKPNFDNGKDVVVQLRSYSEIISETIVKVEQVYNIKLSAEERQAVKAELKNVEFVFHPDVDHSEWFVYKVSSVTISNVFPIPSSTFIPMVMPNGGINSKGGDVGVNNEVIVSKLASIVGPFVLNAKKKVEGDTELEKAETQLTGIEGAQENLQENRPEGQKKQSKINSIKKSQQRLKNALKNIKNLKDASDG